MSAFSFLSHFLLFFPPPHRVCVCVCVPPNKMTISKPVQFFPSNRCVHLFMVLSDNYVKEWSSNQFDILAKILIWYPFQDLSPVTSFKSITFLAWNCIDLNVIILHPHNLLSVEERTRSIHTKITSNKLFNKGQRCILKSLKTVTMLLLSPK